MARNAWLTPGEVSTKTFCRCLAVSVSFREAVTGALLPLTDPNNWEADGEISPEEAAEECAAMLRAYLDGEVCCVPVGTIVMFAGSDVPDGWLVCNGLIYDPWVYPHLFDVIGTMYGEVEGMPLLPSLIGRFPRGVWLAGLGETGGEAEHTLTVDEMPSHGHTTHYHQGYVPIGELTPGAAGPIVQWEGSPTGGGEPHNNLPPYLSVYFIIKAAP